MRSSKIRLACTLWHRLSGAPAAFAEMCMTTEMSLRPYPRARPPRSSSARLRVVSLSGWSRSPSEIQSFAAQREAVIIRSLGLPGLGSILRRTESTALRSAATNWSDCNMLHVWPASTVTTCASGI
jgi:hypothetical protein